MVFMLIAGINFALHFLAWRTLSIRPYLRDPEVKMYFGILFTVAIITTGYLYWKGTFMDFGSALHHGIFQAVSIGTTAGFTTADYYLPVLLAGVRVPREEG